MALVEAGWRLGDRLLVLAAPQLRGDDIAELQDGLNQLGFDCGRPDGIFGPATVRALEDFQRNGGLSPDGICGPADGPHARIAPSPDGLGPGVASVREALTIHESLRTLRIVVGQFGGLSSITRSVTRALRNGGATVMSTDEYEAACSGRSGKPFRRPTLRRFRGAIGRTFVDLLFCRTHVRVDRWSSVGDPHGCRMVHDVLAVPEVRGMRLPVLRETRMPAVLCSLGPVRAAVDATDAVTDTVVTAVTAWTTQHRHRHRSVSCPQVSPQPVGSSRHDLELTTTQRE